MSRLEVSLDDGRRGVHIVPIGWPMSHDYLAETDQLLGDGEGARAAPCRSLSAVGAAYPPAMHDDAPPSLRTRIVDWYSDHRRAATAAVVGGAVVLVGVAAGLAWALTQQSGGVGADPSATPLASLAASEKPSSSVTPTPTAPPSSNAPSPAPSDAPDASALPWPELGEFVPLPPSWGVVVVDGLNVRSGPEDDDPVVGVLNDGDLFLTLEAGGRLQVLADGVTGWVSIGSHEDPWVRAVPTPLSFTWLKGIASDGSSYLAYGMWAELDYPPYEGGFERPLFLRSDDGISWEESHDGVPGQVTAAAGGPDGWVAIGHHSYGGPLLFHSADGQTWGEPVGLEGGQHAVAHGGAGWVVVGYDYSAAIVARRSADGRTWTDPQPLPLDGAGPALEASDAGYVVFDPMGEAGLASVDGVTWHRFRPDTADPARISDVELVGDTVYVNTVDLDHATSAIYLGRLGADGISWTGTVIRSGPFDGFRVDSIASGPDGLLALGWNRDATNPTAWTSPDGAVWTRHDIGADAFGGMIGPEPAWGAGGWVGHGIDVEGDTLWRSPDGASWSFAGRPQPMELADPRCPSTTTVSTLDLAFLGGRAYDCYGSTSLTVRGWVPVPEGLGGCCYPSATPEWLAGAYPRGYLTSAEVDRLSLGLYIPPDVDDGALEDHTWVEVVGHFGDPAADTCRRFPEPMQAHRLESGEVVADDCRRRFVVERISPVEGP